MNDAFTLPQVGPPRSRVDGIAKVTGAAQYAADWPLEGLVFAYIVQSTIANGRITSIDTRAAEAQPGVLAVLTHRNAPRVFADKHTPNDRVLMVLQDDGVHYDRAPVALVVADTFVRAQSAANLVRVQYERATPRTRWAQGITYAPKDIQGKPPARERGNPDAALRAAAVRVDNVYTTPIEHHNPMEPHATIARWDGDHLTLYDATQGVIPSRARVAEVFGIPVESVRIINKFTGGAFGSKGSVWSHVILAAMAARMTQRPVQLAVWRPQMWGSNGNRPATHQRVALGAAHDGTLNVQIHETRSQTSMFDEFVEPSGMLTTVLYPSPALRVSHELTRLNVGTPTYMRAPGESSGSFALESAMDELAYAVGIDPIELRLRNYAEADPSENIPFSSKSLRECYRAAAAAIGWSQRTPKPGSMRDGRMLIGMGMASATYPAHRSKASAIAELHADGTAAVRSAGVDVGTGAYTAFTQIAAVEIGLPPERVQFDLGDSTFPDAPVAGGSQLTASLGSAVKLAANDARGKAMALASTDSRSPLSRVPVDRIDVRDGRLFDRSAPTRGETYAQLIARNGGAAIVGRGDAKPDEQPHYAMHAFGAQFAVVRIDPDLHTIRVDRQVGAFAAGRIINEKTARSQYLGGMIMGLGMALLEETRMDERTGRVMNANLGDYLVPVNADVGRIEAIIVPEDDPHVNPIGVKGIGEIGIVGAAAALANAVYHATGKRVRDLPITPEKLMA